MPELAVDIIRSAVLILMLLTGMAYMTLFERRVISRLQVRLGPNRTGPSGLLQPLADALKLFFKEDVVPAAADRLIYPIAPALALIAALASFAVIAKESFGELILPRRSQCQRPNNSKRGNHEIVRSAHYRRSEEISQRLHRHHYRVDREHGDRK